MSTKGFCRSLVLSLAALAVVLVLIGSAAWAQADPAAQAVKGRAASVAKLVLVFVLFALVAAFGNWLGKDAAMMQKQQEMWSGLFLGGAALALLLVLFIPIFVIGWVLALGAVAGPAVLYVKWRNEQVPSRARAFTPEHLRHVALRILRREQEGEIAAERAVHIGGADHLTQEYKLLYMHSDDMPIRIKPETEDEESAFAHGEAVLYQALARGAEQLYLAPHGNEMLVQCRIDSALRQSGKLDKKLGDGVITFLKRLAGLDLQEHRKPQSGRFVALLNEKPINIRVQTAGSVKGEHLEARLLPRELLRLRLLESGMRQEQAEALRSAMAATGGGVVLMSAPKHSGRTVSMFAALREIDLFARNVLAVEQDAEIEFPDVHQLAVNQAAGQTLAAVVQDALRSDADVILVETVSDAEAARVMLAGAAAGKLLLGGLVANDAAEAVERFMRLVGDAKSAGAVLLAVTNQRLLRTLCTGCREAYRPNPDFLRKANLQSSQVDVLYREPKTRPVNKKGEAIVCPLCRNEGYVGHTVFYEALVLDDQARGELAAGRSVADVRTMLRKQGQEFLQEEGLRKVVAGVTSVTELLRVLKTTG